MKITVTGSLGNISKPLTQKLVAAGHEVTLISSKAENAPAIGALGATPAIGSIEDAVFLQKAFTGADAVYTMVPPNFGAADWKGYIAGQGKLYATAITAAGVKYVVNLSSMGAHLPEGAGPVSGIHFVEEALNELSAVNVLHLRPGFFYNNLYGNIPMIRNMGIIGANYGAGDTLVLADPQDIAAAAAEALSTLSFTGKSVRYVASAISTPGAVAAALGKAIGKSDLPWVSFSDEEAAEGMVQAGLPAEIAHNYAEMGSSVRNGKMFEAYRQAGSPVTGNTSLEDFAAVFAKAF